MSILGIIAEYNPFHNGHQFHLNISKEKVQPSGIICVMSGNFTQRGEIALLDKWSRAEMAIKCGVDLVIELPFVFTARSAESFASGAIRLLDALKIVNTVSFGTEISNYNLLNSIALISENTDFLPLFKKHLKFGKSYPQALATSISSLLNISPEIISKPNNILAIEYLKAIHQYNSAIQPLLIERSIAQHNDTSIADVIASASAIRHQIFTNPQGLSAVKNCIPISTYNVMMNRLQENLLPSLDNLSIPLLAKLRNTTILNLQETPGIAEGLEHKIFNAMNISTSYESLLENIKSKRYPNSRLQRILLHFLIGTKKNSLHSFDKSGPLYARVLGFNQTGRALLKKVKQHSDIPIITKVSKHITSKDKNNSNLTDLQKMLLLDIYATDLFFLSLPDSKKHIGGLDFLNSPIFLI
ncbi:nucleotidyltransferase [Anaerosinus gibii]|uniref:tRNA(Met) cytidine acetate ligase n=2 Tax=Selenobaculum TaxID=3074372 RepID=A0A9Y2ET64_9FIRM|nr:nucleotidyltransferase [Selenobaculum gbiensis]WIW69605.1 nucleotidyltransferase [Selenobaculum gbiensis]